MRRYETAMYCCSRLQQGKLCNTLVRHEACSLQANEDMRAWGCCSSGLRKHPFRRAAFTGLLLCQQRPRCLALWCLSKIICRHRPCSLQASGYKRDGRLGSVASKSALSGVSEDRSAAGSPIKVTLTSFLSAVLLLTGQPLPRLRRPEAPDGCFSISKWTKT